MAERESGPRGWKIPHPRMHERRFVLAPMAELAPELRHPVLGATMRELLANVEGQKVRRVESSVVNARQAR